MMFGQIRLIGELDSFLERGAGAPAKPGKTADVEQFARRPVRPRGVEADLAGVSDGRGDHAGEFGDGDVLAGADIDQFFGRAEILGIDADDGLAGFLVDAGFLDALAAPFDAAANFGERDLDEFATERVSPVASTKSSGASACNILCMPST